MKDRRDFLKNLSYTTLGLAGVPLVAASKLSARPAPAQPLDCNPTTLDLYGQGPFYTPNPPLISEGQLAAESEPGTRLTISGRVRNLDCTQFLPDTEIDIWHADDAGQYDNEGYNLRGVVYANAQGFYVFHTIYPGKYLNGAQFRPSHIHFKITPPGHPELITQLYFEGDPDLASDAASSVNSGIYDASERIIALQEDAAGDLSGEWDIVVDGQGITGLQDLYLDKGMLYQVSPNPFTDQLTIGYGVFSPSRVGLRVYDLQGRLIAELEDRELEPEKYTAYWNASDYPAGQYFIVLQVNDIQVHHSRVLKQ